MKDRDSMFKSVALVLLAVLPAILIATFVYKKDKNKEPLSMMVILFCFGIISSLAVITISYLLEYIFPVLAKDTQVMSLFELFIKTFIEIALIEELCKWLVVYFMGYNNKLFDETYDVIIYAVFVTLGFATFENVIYVLENKTFGVAIQRALLSIPGHVAYGIFMSYYLCLARIGKLKNNRKEEKKCIVKSIIVPTIFHGIFDFCLFTGKTIFIVIFIAFVVTLFFMAFQILRELYKMNASLLSIKRTCNNCGRIIYGDVCYNCKTRQD